VTNAPAVGAGVGRADLTGEVGIAPTRPRRLTTAVVGLLLAAIGLLNAGVSLGAAAPNSLPLRATYDVSAYIHWGRGSMTVASTAHVTNTTRHDVRALTFNLVPLVTGDADLVRAKVRGKPVDATAVGQTIVITLPRALAPEERTDVTIRYRARFNAVSDESQHLFSESDGIITAYRWIPWLSRRQAFAAPNFGETWVTSVSPRVTVKLSSRETLVYATSGVLTGASRHSRTFTAYDVRDFNFSASPDYRVKRARTGTASRSASSIAVITLMSSSATPSRRCVGSHTRLGRTHTRV